MSPFALALPIAAFGLIWVGVWRHRTFLGIGSLSIRGTFLVAFLGFETVLVALTEVLSAPHWLRPEAVVAGWLVVFYALGPLVFRVVHGAAFAAPRDVVRRVVQWIVLQPALALCAIVALLVFAGVASVVGWRYWPNNGDAMMYHLPRVAHWIQNESVSHFATHYTAQIELAPLHEFNLLHLHLLTDTDRFDGFVQLFGYVVCVLGAAEVARLLGGGRAVQLGAALICATVPNAVLESTSTQNNVFAAAIGIAVVVLLLAWGSQRWGIRSAAAVGFAAGLVILAKGTLVLLVPTIALLALRPIVADLRSKPLRSALRRFGTTIAVSGCCALAVAGPFLTRNRRLFGTFTGPVTDGTINAHWSLRWSAVNVVRAAALNFRVGDEHGGLDTLVQRAGLATTRRLAEWIGIPPDDPDFVLGIGWSTDAFGGRDFRWMSRTEEFGGNPWHLLLLCVAAALFVAVVLRGDSSARLPAALAIALVVGFVIFFGTARWSVVIARYQVPTFVLAAPLVALALRRVRPGLLWLVSALLLVAAVPQLIANQTRSLVVGQQFPNAISHYLVSGQPAADYTAVVDAVVRTGCTRVGIGNWVYAEYAIWAGLEHGGWIGEIEHVGVLNPSRELERPGFEPCAVVFQTVDRPDVTRPAGWVWQSFGDLGLALAPGLTDGA